MEYTVKYNTGAGDFTIEGSLHEAMLAADDVVVYTQQPITIVDETGNEVARREWYGVLTGIEDAEDPIQFGEFGFYADWQCTSVV